MYELMRAWDEDQPGQNDAGDEFAAAWRAKPKWVVSRTLETLGPNASLVSGDLEGFVRKLKAERDGELEVAGPKLAGSLATLGLIDIYQLYLQPVVLGGGRPFFSGRQPPLRLVASEEIGQTVRLTYETA